MQDSEFVAKVAIVLNNIIDNIEMQDIDGEIDIDSNNGTMLTIITSDGTFVINKQSSVQEIWLSSPISGPYHFIFSENAWKSRYGIELFSLLTDELKIQFSN